MMSAANRETVAAFVIARNEEKWIKPTIKSLLNQTVEFERIVLVDDGSTDRTGELAASMGCKIITLPYHERTYVGRPELAEVFNFALEYLSHFQQDFLLQMGSDTVLSNDYVELILERMDEQTVIASGCLNNIPRRVRSPMGTGRLIRAAFWREVSGMLYPKTWGWETWLLIKAKQMGYKTVCYNDIVATGRDVAMPAEKAFHWGKAMYMLGYHELYAFLRSLKFCKQRSLQSGLAMWLGYMSCLRQERLDTAAFLSESQKLHLIKRLLSKMVGRM